MPISTETSNLDGNAAGISSGFRLTRMEATLLHWLRQYPRQCLSREFLLQTVWGYQPGVRSRTLDVHIRRLRRKLGPIGACIKTIFRDGYCWYPEPKAVSLPTASLHSRGFLSMAGVPNTAKMQPVDEMSPELVGAR